ncbi:WYL domain-containing protein [Arcanobacterium bovis]|uniref:WYL domain-containing protein n=1 Tax=Arcanobacterium bovis TaxID=2529275 RepID=A0A4Q9V2X5_9ACTO|nr:WYL domain-containing protein [Arcanobacterium bovis]TBW22928.1 WYL domain-containing protein [Arcanobacterium bovis]
MANNEENRTGERRITLALYLMERKASFEDIRALPVYRELFEGKSYDAFRDMVEKDIKVLRDSSYVVEQALNKQGEYKYWINNSAGIRVDAHGSDLSVLYGVLGHKGRSDAEQFMQMGVHKLLADTASAEQSSVFRANMPRGEFITEIANALQYHQLIEFRYQSTTKNAQALYVVQPQKIHVHFESFYFSGWEVSVDGVATGAQRVYKVSRIQSTPKLLKDGGAALGSKYSNNTDQLLDSVADTSADASAAFSAVQATVLIKDGTCAPFAAMASEELEAPAGYQRLEFSDIDKHELFDYLIFYGTDAYLEAPVVLRQEFIDRMRYLVTLGSAEGDC